MNKTYTPAELEVIYLTNTDIILSSEEDQMGIDDA